MNGLAGCLSVGGRHSFFGIPSQVIVAVAICWGLG